MIETLLIPYPKHNNQLVSMNLWNRLHWNTRKNIKQNLKSFLKNWFIEEKERQYGALHFNITVLRKSKRKYDAINSAQIFKVIEDIFTEQGWVKDDDKNSVTFNPTILDCDVKRDMLKIEVIEIKGDM